MAVVVLRNLRQLKDAIEAYGREGEEAVIGALVKAARFGATAVQRTASQTDPRPFASQTYQRSWVVNKLDDGAALQNSAGHAYFVEVGRRPGRAPPREPILEWIYQKRLMKRPKKLKKRKRIAANKLDKIERENWAIVTAQADAKQMADLIRWKIKARGFPGRFVLERTMPAIAKRTQREVKQAMNKLSKKPPRQ